MKNRIRYTCQGYRYAPESFKAYRVLVDQSGRGNHFYEKLDFTHEENTEIGYAYVTKGNDAAEAIIKRLVRKQERKPKEYMTYGFRDVENPKTCHFTQQILVRPTASITDKHRAFREFKDYLLSNGCKIKRYTSCKLDGRYQVESKEDVYDEVDITKPVRVRILVA